MLKSIFVRFFFSIYFLLYWYGIEPTVGHRCMSTGPTPLPQYRPTSLLWVSTIFFYSLWIPDLTFQIKITLSVRNLSGTNMYICMWSFFARYSSFYIIHCVHDKINNYFIFFLANIEIWPNKITAQIILNQDESGNPVWRYDTDHILDLFDFTNNLCS